MIVIAREAEKKLLQNLRKSRNPSQKYFFLEFSKADIPHKDLFDAFFRVLQDIPNAYLAHIYICQDYDVFIVLQGFMQRQFAELLKKLSEEVGSGSLAQLADVFELGSHAGQLEEMCQAKIDRIKEEGEKEAQAERKKESDKITLDGLSRLDADSVATISVRRNKRAETLVMIADDDQLTRTLVDNVLNKDFRLCFAKNGQQALIEYVISAPDLLFLDIGLPDISGHQVLECLFQIDPEAYVIMFSGRKNKENMLHAMRTGAQGFVGKPFTREKLFQYVEKSPYIKAKRKPTEKQKSMSG